MSSGSGPVAPEVDTLDQYVGGRHDPAVLGAYDRGVVAGPELDVGTAGQAPGDRRDKADLAELADRLATYASGPLCPAPGRHGGHAATSAVP